MTDETRTFVPNHNPNLMLAAMYEDTSRFFPIVAWWITPPDDDDEFNNNISTPVPHPFVEMTCNEFAVYDRESNQWWSEDAYHSGVNMKSLREYFRRDCEKNAPTDLQGKINQPGGET